MIKHTLGILRVKSLYSSFFPFFFSLSKRSALEILQLSEGVQFDQIKKQYLLLSKKYHPDLNSDTDSENKFKCISEAFNTLKSYYNVGEEEDYSCFEKKKGSYNKYDEGIHAEDLEVIKKYVEESTKNNKNRIENEKKVYSKENVKAFNQECSKKQNNLKCFEESLARLRSSKGGRKRKREEELMKDKSD